LTGLKAFFIFSKMETIVLRTFDNYVKAHITSDKLTDAGVENYLFDEASVTTAPFLGNAIGGIKLVVDQADAQRAQQALFEIDEAYRKTAQCSRCGGHNIEVVTKQSATNIFTIVATWLFSKYAPPGDQLYKCSDCGNETDALPEPMENDPSKDLL
jgi:hypothetical protein